MPRKSSFGANLNRELYANGLTQVDIAQEIHRSQQYVSSRLTGKCPWNMDDVYALCDMLDIDINEIPKYFPRREARAQ